MANWWNDNKVLLKRSWRYEGYFGLNSSLGGVDGTVYDTNVGEYVPADNQSEIPKFLIHSFEKPTVKTAVHDFGGQNPLNGMIVYNVENFIWGDVKIEVYDSFVKDKTKVNNISYEVMSWLTRLGYNPQAMSQATGAGSSAGLANFIGELNTTTIALNIEVKDDVGATVEKWEFLEPRLSSIDFGKASYGSDDLPLVSLSFSVAAVKYE